MGVERLDRSHSKYDDRHQDRLQLVFDLIDRGMPAEKIAKSPRNPEVTIYSKKAYQFDLAIRYGMPLEEDNVVQHDYAIQKGINTEKNAFNVLSASPDVILVMDATPEQDVNLGIDMWVVLSEEYGNEVYPVQVKSSSYFVHEFRQSDKYPGIREELDLVVINANSERNPELILEDFFEEVSEITGIR